MFVLLALLCLTCRISIWCAIGMLVFTGLYFRPQGMHAAIGGGILAVLVILPTVLLLAPTGGMENKLMYGIFNGFGSDGAEELMRSASTTAISYNSANFFLRLLGYTFAQFNSMYINMGAIITTPFFLLALLNKFRNPAVEAGKWAVFAMWLGACFTVCGGQAPVESSAEGKVLHAPAPRLLQAQRARALHPLLLDWNHCCLHHVPEPTNRRIHVLWVDDLVILTEGHP